MLKIGSIALESGLLCRRVKTSNFLLLVVSKQFFLSKVIKSLITFPELNNKYQLIPPEIIPQLEVKDSELDKAMNSPEDEHQMLCDPAKTKPLKDPLNCRVIESSTKTCDNKPKMYDEKLKTFDEKPKTFDEKHKTFDEKPKTFDDKPKTCDEKHKTFDEKPKTFDDKPKTCDEKPKMCDEKPKTCDEKPKTCDEKPKTCDEKPKTCDEKPKTCDEKPKTCDEKPKTCDEKPKTCDEKPKTCDEKPVALSSKLVGVDGKHSLLRNNLRTNLSSKCTLTNRPSFLKDPHLARVLPYGDYGQMVLLDSCDLGAVIEDVIRSLSESCIDYKIVHEKPTARGSKRKEKECGLNLNTCRILIGGKTVTVGQHKKMRSATVIAAKKLMTKLKSQHFFVKGPRPRILPVPFIPDEKAFVSYAEKLLQEYSREETSSALVLKTDLGTKKEKILGRIAKKLDLKIYHSQPNIHFLVITKLTNFWTLVKLLASGEQNVNYKLIAPSS
ncbi:unnamed protein product [Timema podura]|uniref:DRBM domain-containing protein n=1 Tax=Timema podura TaxID=61482 RepID=A0ABN7P0F0_TIMPD|nr:unnamed protein product [Timema podura]